MSTSSFATIAAPKLARCFHPGRYVPPDQQAIERQKALNQNPPGLTMAECETPSIIRRSRLYPTDLVPCHSTRCSHTTRTMPSSSTAGTPRLRNGLNYPSPRQAKTTRPPSTLPTNGSFWSNWYGKPGRHRLSRACKHIGPQHTRASEMPSSRPNRTYPRERPKWPYWTTKNFLATQAGTDLWTLEPQQLQRLVKAFHDWEKVNFTQMVTGHNNGLLDYLEHKDSIAHLQDFLDVVLPNLHQHYICRSTDCSFVIKASHWINSATPDKQGKYLCPRCRTEYRPWAAAAVNNPNKRFCPAAQCLVTKVTSATPPDSDGWAQQLTNHTTSTRYVLFVSDEVPNNQRPEVAQRLQTSSRPGGNSSQPIT